MKNKKIFELSEDAAHDLTAYLALGVGLIVVIALIFGK
jgi:hypothetical protein